MLHRTLRDAANMGIKLYVLVPLGDMGRYRIPDYELDASHIIAEDEDWWCELLNHLAMLLRSFVMKLKASNSQPTAA